MQIIPMVVIRFSGFFLKIHHAAPVSKSGSIILILTNVIAEQWPEGIVFCIHPLISPTAFGNAQSYPMMDTSGYHLDHLQSEFVTTMV